MRPRLTELKRGKVKAEFIASPEMAGRSNLTYKKEESKSGKAAKI